MKLSTGMHVPIHSYKHNKRLHRIWKKTMILSEDQHCLVTGHHRTRVIEHDGRSWHTKEPAICYFYNDLWFNIIGMLKKMGFTFIAIYQAHIYLMGEAVKYIDYDLDVKVFPDGRFIVLDEKEYNVHSDKMCYSDEIHQIITKQLDILIEKIKAKEKPFDLSDIHLFYDQYKHMNKR